MMSGPMRRRRRGRLDLGEVLVVVVEVLGVAEVEPASSSREEVDRLLVDVGGPVRRTERVASPPPPSPPPSSSSPPQAARSVGPTRPAPARAPKRPSTARRVRIEAAAGRRRDETGASGGHVAPPSVSVVELVERSGWCRGVTSGGGHEVGGLAVPGRPRRVAGPEAVERAVVAEVGDSAVPSAAVMPDVHGGTPEDDLVDRRRHPGLPVGRGVPADVHLLGADHHQHRDRRPPARSGTAIVPPATATVATSPCRP